jgi:hypothetical protein
MTQEAFPEMKALVDVLIDLIRLNHRQAIDVRCQTGGVEKLLRSSIRLDHTSTRSHWTPVASILHGTARDNVEQNPEAAQAFAGSDVQHAIFDLLWKGIANGCEANANEFCKLEGTERIIIP